MKAVHNGSSAPAVVTKCYGARSETDLRKVSHMDTYNLARRSEPRYNGTMNSSPHGGPQ